VTLGLSAATLLTLSVWGISRFGSQAAAVGYLRGEIIHADARIKSFGDQPIDTKTEVSFVLTNLTSRPIKIVGSSTTCSCTIAENLPMTIVPHGSASVNVAVSIGQELGAVRQDVEFYTDCPNLPSLVVSVAGQAVSQ
jgi:hypothetical protein